MGIFLEKIKTTTVLLFSVILFALAYPSAALALGTISAALPCASGGFNVADLGTYCGRENPNEHGWVYGPGQQYAAQVDDGTADEFNYVPHSGNYMLVGYGSDAPNISMMTIRRKDSREFINGGKVYLSSLYPLMAQKLVSQKAKVVFSATRRSAYCLALRDLSNGKEYGTPSNFIIFSEFCQDLDVLPSQPAYCDYNLHTDLDIQFGQLAREEIPVTLPAVTGAFRQTKHIPITCSGDAAVNIKAKLTFISASFNQNYVSSNNPDLGFAILHNDKVLKPQDEIDLAIPAGGSDDIALDIAVIRNADIKATDMATGNFSASAVLSFTEN